MYPYPFFEDFGFITVGMKKYWFCRVRQKNKSYVDVKNIKSIAHTKTFSNYIWLCVVNGRIIRVIIFVHKLVSNIR